MEILAFELESWWAPFLLALVMFMHFWFELHIASKWHRSIPGATGTACSSLPRLVLHSYFRWIPVVVKSRLDWNKSVSIPKAVLKGLKRSVDFVRKFSGTIRRKSYVYETLLPENKIKKEKIEIAGDGNDLYGCHYQVGEDFSYKIVRFDDIQKGELSSSFRELLVLHDCIK